MSIETPWDPPTNKIRKTKNLTYGVFGINKGQTGRKEFKNLAYTLPEIILEIIQNEDCGYNEIISLTSHPEDHCSQIPLSKNKMEMIAVKQQKTLNHSGKILIIVSYLNINKFVVIHTYIS